MNNTKKASGKLIFTISHHTRHICKSVLLWGSSLKQAKECTKQEHCEAPYSDSTKSQNTHWSKMEGE